MISKGKNVGAAAQKAATDVAKEQMNDPQNLMKAANLANQAQSEMEKRNINLN